MITPVCANVYAHLVMFLKNMAELEFLVPAGSPTAASSTDSVATRLHDGQYAYTVGKHFKQLMNDGEYKARRYLRQIVLIITTISTHQTALQNLHIQFPHLLQHSLHTDQPIHFKPIPSRCISPPSSLQPSWLSPLASPLSQPQHPKSLSASTTT